MEKRQLGKSLLEVAPIAFGGNVFGWTIDEPKSFELLDQFVANGFNLIDTADGYSRWAPGNKGGESETIIGNWHKNRRNREQIIIATKVGTDMGQGKIITKKYILEAVEHSLRRLQTDYIDLYQTHHDNESTPVEETLSAYAELIQQGKVRYIGASNMSPQRFQASLEASRQYHLPAYISLQPLFNLYEREPFEAEKQQLCLDNNIAVLPYYSLASGFLTGKYRSEADLIQSARGKDVKKYLTPRGFAILNALDEVAGRHRVKPASVAIAWLKEQPAVVAPIVSATSTAQLQSLFEAVALRLSDEELALLNTASDWQ